MKNNPDIYPRYLNKKHPNQAEQISYKKQIGTNAYNEKLKLYLDDNHAKFKAVPTPIGFIDLFPEKPGGVIDEMTVTLPCRKGRFQVTFKVRYGKVTFGPNNQNTCSGITTDRVDISEHLPLGGFNSFCCYDEAETMEQAVIMMAKKHNLILCHKACSWPHAKAIVDKVSESHVKHFKIAGNES